MSFLSLPTHHPNCPSTNHARYHPKPRRCEKPPVSTFQTARWCMGKRQPGKLNWNPVLGPWWSVVLFRWELGLEPRWRPWLSLITAYLKLAWACPGLASCLRCCCGPSGSGGPSERITFFTAQDLELLHKELQSSCINGTKLRMYKPDP